jgi:hypothetical protein
MQSLESTSTASGARILNWPSPATATPSFTPCVAPARNPAPRQQRTTLPIATALHTGLQGWHLLSLDAPTVAALWTFFVAYVAGVRLHAIEVAAMAVAVWLLYAADRLLDAGAGPHPAQQLEQRHLFHAAHAPRFLLGFVAASILLACMLPLLPIHALRLYLVLGALLAGWFLLIHTGTRARRLPKEIGVGMFFPAAVFIPTVARVPQMRLALLPEALLFAAVCSLNCLAIYAWEHVAPAPDTHWSTRLAVPRLRLLLILTITAATLLAFVTPWPLRSLAIASGLSASGLLWLDSISSRIAGLTLRASADAMLLTPLLLLGLRH